MAEADITGTVSNAKGHKQSVRFSIPYVTT